MNIQPFLSIVNYDADTVEELKKYYGAGSPCRTLLYCLRLAALYYSQGIQKSYTKTYGILKRLQTNDIRQAGIRS